MKEGDSVFSKSGIEFYTTIVEVKGSKVVLEYNDDYEERFVVFKSCLTKLGDGWEMPNWTITPEQLQGEDDD